MQNRWSILAQSDEKEIDTLYSELKISRNIIKLLLQRKINSIQKARLFFRPTLNNLHNPFLMKDMDKAVNRILQAIENNENILIYGDYDVDGTTAVSAVYLFLFSYYNKVSYYIPDRYEEGYGISFQGIDYAKDNNISLIIALDCGIKELDKVEYANKKNIDFIICDHHLPGEKIPDAIAVLDPQRTDCNYPYKFLSGCGVGFKLIQALAEKLNLPQEKVFDYLDLVAVSIAADIVPITGENRILSIFGLKKLNEDPRLGLKVFTSEQTKGTYNISSIVFSIAPKINAAGRITHASDSVRLLTSQNEPEARKIYSSINQINTHRRELDNSITESALKEIKSSGQINNYSTVIYNPEWHKGVIGIVASRLIETYYRPTLVFTKGKENELVASARSVFGYDIYKALENCVEYLDKFGGHMYAAGLTLKKKNFSKFKMKFEETVKNTISENQRIPTIEIDQEIDFSELTEKFFRLIFRMEPFGPENMNPVFLTKNVQYAGNGTLKKIGEDKSHLKLDVFQGKSIIPAIAFGKGDLFEKIEHSLFDLVYSLDKNIWQGRTYYKINIKDIRFKN